MDWNHFEIQVKTLFGLEEVLAAEIKALGGSDIEIRNRAVVCYGDLPFVYKLNYSCRTALKVNIPILFFHAKNEQEYYNRIEKFAWEEYLSEEDAFHIDFTVHSTVFSHSQYAMLKMKDAIIDRFRRKTDQRPNISNDENSIKFHLHIQEQKVTISLDSSGEALYKRGYRTQTTEAPINEVLAAGMLHLAGWKGDSNFLDPMCGSGTLLIEAAMMAYNIPPQINREHFGFMNWTNYDAAAWETIIDTRNNKMKEFNYEIIGYDKDARAIDAAEENLENGGLEDMIIIERQDFFETEKKHSPLMMVFNPPYNERIEIEEDFYKEIGDTLKHNYPHTIAWLISADLRIDKKMGLRPSERQKLFNGNLECKFLRYEMYEGSRKNKDKE